MESPNSQPVCTILHCSDIHVGRGFHEEPAECFLTLARDLRPDAVIVSGDFTMRARRGQFLRARALVERMPKPRVLIPGNHDIPLYLLPVRLFAPFRNYRRFIADLDQSPLDLQSVAVLALNTINPFRHQEGILTHEQMERVRGWSRGLPPRSWRVLVVHQHFANMPDNPRPGIYPRARERLREIAQAGVHLVLHGHVHQSSFRTGTEMFDGFDRRIVVAAVGTLSCARLRGPVRVYQFNRIEFTKDMIRLQMWSWNSDRHTFLPAAERIVSRDWFGK